MTKWYALDGSFLPHNHKEKKFFVLNGDVWSYFDYYENILLIGFDAPFKGVR